MPTGVDPTARVIRNLLTIQRLGNTVSADMRRLWRELADQIVADLAKIDPTGPGLRYSGLRLDRLLAAVEDRIREQAPEIYRVLRLELADIGRSQALWAQQTIVVSLGDFAGSVKPTPVTRNMALAVMDTDPFGDTARGVALLKEWSEGIEDSTVRRLRSAIRLGVLNEEDIPTIARRVRGTGIFSGGMAQTIRESEALARTAVSEIVNEAHRRTYEANKSVLAGVRFVAALDDRTTELCAALDGSFWPLGSPDIQTPPLHWQCRSVLVPEVDYEKLGLDPPPEGERVARNLGSVSEEDLQKTIAERRRKQGLGTRALVPSSVTYQQWLRTQPDRVQDRVLGRGKAELFRSGEVTLKDLIRSDNSVRPLRDLLDA
jgi:SPP1 gp7 family putative phage head morphogenesis protein